MSANNFIVDESMIPYYGSHGTKQFIRGKPIRFRLRLSTSDGYLFHAEPYRGKGTYFPETGLGQGSDVFLGMI